MDLQGLESHIYDVTEPWRLIPTKRNVGPYQPGWCPLQRVEYPIRILQGLVECGVFTDTHRIAMTSGSPITSIAHNELRSRVSQNTGIMAHEGTINEPIMST